MSQSPPMVGSWKVRVHGVRPYSIHGDLYYEVVVSPTDGAEGVTALKVPQHAVEGTPAVGEVVAVTFLMGQVTGVKRVTAD